VPWHLWALRDAGAVDLGAIGSERAARALATSANERQSSRGLSSLGVSFEARPAGYEPEGFGRVPSCAGLYWRDDRQLPGFLQQGKTERRDPRLAPELEAAERAKRRAAPVARERVPPAELSALVERLSRPAQRGR